MKILVTGAAGYIGSHFCKLYENDHTIIGIDNLIRGNPEHFRGKELLDVDIKHTKRLAEILIEHSIELVVHFAAYAYVGESCDEPLKYYDNNVSGTLSLLSAMEMASVSKLIFSSSCATYGVPPALPIMEQTDQKPVNPYGDSKFMCERIIADQCTTEKLQAIGLRYFNVIGGDETLEIGEIHTPETHILPNIIKAAVDENFYLDLYGGDYETKDGTCERDYVDVCDLARAHERSIKHLATKSASYCEFINIGGGRPVSILELIRCVETISQKNVKFRVLPRRKGDVPCLYADARNARTLIGWAPEISLEQSVLTAYQWYLKLRD